MSKKEKQRNFDEWKREKKRGETNSLLVNNKISEPSLVDFENFGCKTIAYYFIHLHKNDGW